MTKNAAREVLGKMMDDDDVYLKVVKAGSACPEALTLAFSDGRELPVTLLIVERGLDEVTVVTARLIVDGCRLRIGVAR